MGLSSERGDKTDQVPDSSQQNQHSKGPVGHEQGSSEFERCCEARGQGHALGTRGSAVLTGGEVRRELVTGAESEGEDPAWGDGS